MAGVRGGLPRRVKGSALSIAILLVALAASGPAAAAPGDLDPSFGSYGVQRIAFGNGPHDRSVGTLIGTQPSGLPVLAGAVETIVSGHLIYDVYTTFAAARLSDQGTLDAGFGDGGLLVGGLGFGEDDEDSDLMSAALAADGRIVVGGAGPDYRTFSVARLTTDGALDPTFSGDGVASFSLPDAHRFSRSARVGVLSDGSVVLAGIDGSGTFGEKLPLIKFSADGTLDRSFGTNGQVSSPSEPMRAINSLVVDSENRILISDGIARPFAEPPESIDEVSRFLPDGEPDMSFGSDGTRRVHPAVTDVLPGTGTYGPPLAVDSDDRIYALSARSLTRLAEDGRPDSSFGADGTVELPAGLANVAVYPDPAGGVFLAGIRDEVRAGWFLTTALAVGHLLDNGDVDPDFGAGGWSRTYQDHPIWGPSMLKLSPDELTVAASGKSVLLARLQLQSGAASDADADGVEDQLDRCPERSGSGGSGCPAYRSSVELSRWSPGRSGHLAGVLGEVSADSRCLVQREIRVFTVRGRKLVGSATTSGPYPEFFVRTSRRLRGRVFAVARGFRDPRFGVCQSSRSKAFVIPGKR